MSRDIVLRTTNKDPKTCQDKFAYAGWIVMGLRALPGVS